MRRSGSLISYLLTISLFLMLCGALLSSMLPTPAHASEKLYALKQGYAAIAQRSYAAAHHDATLLRDSVDVLAKSPSQIRLRQAQDVWKAARDSYARTELFRFYGGPIDYVDPVSGKSGPRKDIYGYPVDVNAIEYVLSDELPMDENVLRTRTQQGLAHSGFHALEYLLWDYSADEWAAKDARGMNLRQFAQLLAEMLQDDLQFLSYSWAQEGENNYSDMFLARPDISSFEDMMTGFISLPEELAAQLEAALRADAVMHQPAIFSHTTRNAMARAIEGLLFVYEGQMPGFDGVSVHPVIRDKNVKVAQDIALGLQEVHRALLAIPVPMAQQVAYGHPNTEPHERTEHAATLLRALAARWRDAAAMFELDIPASIPNEGALNNAYAFSDSE